MAFGETAGVGSIGAGSARRFANQGLAGLELALWDLTGKAKDELVHRLLGGAVHDSIGYFAFPQGETPAELAEAAGLDICLHGIFESGITTCAANQAATTIPILDDGNNAVPKWIDQWDFDEHVGTVECP